LSCIDSRVPVETIFDQGIGDVFVARIAGNFENTDILGSLEYSCKAAGSKLVLVLGHESCGAVKAAIDGVELGNITAMLANILPAVKLTVKKSEGEASSSNPEFVSKTVENNVTLTIGRIREKSPILMEMEEKGEIKIVGGVYHLSSGKVILI
ncbi:MAG: carbonic anhydrase, partial [Maribacter sp.]|nr:carbonic anhydrase [Maribacter sp.]